MDLHERVDIHVPVGPSVPMVHVLPVPLLGGLEGSGCGVVQHLKFC